MKKRMCLQLFEDGGGAGSGGQGGNAGDGNGSQGRKSRKGSTPLLFSATGVDRTAGKSGHFPCGSVD